eukprot:11883219-Alexandrium_andersonii.AAC.1
MPEPRGHWSLALEVPAVLRAVPPVPRTGAALHRIQAALERAASRWWKLGLILGLKSLFPEDTGDRDDK